VLPGDTAEATLADARRFLSDEAFYAEHGIPYRRGYWLHGSPGSGKSSLVTAISGEL
jgi:chaperone BCS1